MGLTVICGPCGAASLRGHLPTTLPVVKDPDGYYHLSIPSLPYLVMPDAGDVIIVEVGSSSRGEIFAPGEPVVTDEKGHVLDGWKAGDPDAPANLEMGSRFLLIVETASIDFHVPGPGTYKVSIRVEAKNRRGEKIWIESDSAEIKTYEDNSPNKPPLRMPVSGTPAADAPVAPPPGIAGR